MSDFQRFHRVKLNLPSHFNGELPNPIGAPVYIDDKPLMGVCRFSLETSPETGVTIVNISMVASVEGLVEVDEPCLLVVQQEEKE